MTVADARDLAIIISSIIGTGVLVSFLVIIFLVYRRVRVILDSVAEVSLSLRQAAAVIKGMIQGCDLVSRIFHKTEGGKEK
jgi:hypothetical protein